MFDFTNSEIIEIKLIIKKAGVKTYVSGSSSGEKSRGQILRRYEIWYKYDIRLHVVGNQAFVKTVSGLGPIFMFLV